MVLSRCDNRIIKSCKIFDSKFEDFLPYFGFQQSAFGTIKTASAECQQPIANSQSKSLFFVHKVTAFHNAVVGSAKHLKAAVSVDSAQVFRCYETARVYICKVDYVYNAALALFAFAERVVGFFYAYFKPRRTSKRTVRNGIRLREKLAHSVFGGDWICAKGVAKYGMQLSFRNFFASAFHSAGFEHRCVF